MIEVVGIIAIGALVYVLLISYLLYAYREQLREEEHLSPITQQFREWEAAKARTYARQGISPLGQERDPWRQ